MMENYVMMQMEEKEEIKAPRKIQINNTTIRVNEYESSQWRFF